MMMFLLVALVVLAILALFSLVVSVVTVVLVVTALWGYSTYRHNFWTSRGVPTAPVLLPLLGHSTKLLASSTTRCLYLDEVYKNHGGSRFCGLYEQLTPVLIIGDPELIKAVLIKDFEHFVDRRSVKFTSEKDEIFNELLNRAKGDHWKRIRSLLSPNFASGKLKGMFPLVEMKADGCTDYIHRKMKAESAVPLRRCFGLYTLEVISSCAFGMETNSFVNEDSTFNKMVEKLQHPDPATVRKFLVFRMFPKVAAALKLSFTQPEMDFFKTVVAETIKQRESGRKRGDFLDLMMEARQTHHDSMKDSTIVAHSILFILAGYDTTSNALAFTTFLLAQHPKEQELLRHEIQSIIQKQGSLTYQAVMEAKRLDACISEALRLYPVAHFHERQCTKDYIIPDTDVVNPAQTMVIVPTWSLHRDPCYWSDPEVFRPVRFLLENKDQIKSGTFLPFGLGPRTCIGMRFALMEAKLVLAKILLEFELKCLPGYHELQMEKGRGLMRLAPGLCLSFTPIVQETQQPATSPS